MSLATLATGQVGAQSDEPFYFGFGSAFGRGTYELADGTEVEIYRAQFKPRIRASAADREDGRGPGIRLIMPATVGLTDSSDDTLGLDPLPIQPQIDRADAVAFMPGVELEHTPGKRLTLRTSIQGGWARELGGGDESARLAAAGVRARLKFVDTPARPTLIAGVLWAGVDPDDGDRRSLVRLTTALEFDIAVHNWRVRGHEMRLLPHVLEDRFYRPPPALALGDEPDGDLPNRLGTEQQIGIAAGRDEPFKIWFLKFDAVGIAYRFSDRSRGIRLYLNSVF